MPVKDIFHETVKQALIKDGWIIFGHCFLSGLRYLIKHKISAIEAREKVKQEILWTVNQLRSQEKIPSIKRDIIITALMHNIDFMVCDLNWHV